MGILDFRINNIVTIDNPKFHPQLKDKPLIIVGINQTKDTENNDTYSIQLNSLIKRENIIIPMYAQFLKYIKPIDLTEDLLFNCQFEKIYSSSFRIKYDNIKYNEIGFDFDFVDSGMGGFRHYGKHIKIKYLNQLQNLYYDFKNEELQIKL